MHVITWCDVKLTVCEVRELLLCPVRSSCCSWLALLTTLQPLCQHWSPAVCCYSYTSLHAHRLSHAASARSRPSRTTSSTTPTTTPKRAARRARSCQCGSRRLRVLSDAACRCTKGVGRTAPLQWQDAGDALDNEVLRGCHMPAGQCWYIPTRTSADMRRFFRAWGGCQGPPERCSPAIQRGERTSTARRRSADDHLYSTSCTTPRRSACGKTSHFRGRETTDRVGPGTSSWSTSVKAAPIRTAQNPAAGCSSCAIV
jgi:hypothetical protein